MANTNMRLRRNKANMRLRRNNTNGHYNHSYYFS